MTDFFVDGQVSHQDGDVEWVKMTAADFITAPAVFVADVSRREFAADFTRREFTADNTRREFRRP